MSTRFRLTIAQYNPTVGDVAGNAEKAFEAWQFGKAAGADMVGLPEMFLSGYQTQDLAMRRAFTDDVRNAAEALAERTADGPPCGVGGPVVLDGVLYNGYFILEGGKLKTILSP